jgi:hypothetical protein
VRKVKHLASMGDPRAQEIATAVFNYRLAVAKRKSVELASYVMAGDPEARGRAFAIFVKGLSGDYRARVISRMLWDAMQALGAR